MLITHQIHWPNLRALYRSTAYAYAQTLTRRPFAYFSKIDYEILDEKCEKKRNISIICHDY